MEKYITDAIHNSLRTVTYGMTRPQQKAIAEVVRGLFTKGETILRHLAQGSNVRSKISLKEDMLCISWVKKRTPSIQMCMCS